MSDTDSFIEEVTEEVRRDQLYKYVRKFGWVAVVLVLAVVGTTGYLEWQKSNSAKQAQALGDKLVLALESDDPKTRAAALEELAPESGNAQVIVELRRAGELLEAGETDAALAVFDGVANGGADVVYKDMARLKGVLLRGAGPDRDAILVDLSASGRPFRPLALEQQAIAALDNNDTDQAIALFTELFEDSETTDGLRNRATQMLVALGAEVPSNPQLLSE